MCMRQRRAAATVMHVVIVHATPEFQLANISKKTIDMGNNMETCGVEIRGGSDMTCDDNRCETRIKIANTDPLRVQTPPQTERTAMAAPRTRHGRNLNHRLYRHNHPRESTDTLPDDDASRVLAPSDDSTAYQLYRIRQLVDMLESERQIDSEEVSNNALRQIQEILDTLDTDNPSEMFILRQLGLIQELLRVLEN